ncbi:TetR/AcrR family transcriptional regulator [Allosediminivita pacifica]|uniref:TetR family transcriptional regulator n=1 Tax=Allosediminivita pacifica TaxID=1267769 RepID=A0A2T6A6J0_9RHOB|nr:TetR/AcrR family transcriptional regulator [Allosediminivita pacifica]PTX39372.1 TetR family transcriptional regulator [Allosediminivita pacifica]GGB27892.1 TetR family transcriptional regulator [Allosediminivita pacifica]
MPTPKRKPRSDALRNRERLIEAAKDVLGPGGPNASLEAVAKRAGVGIGTLYRHFPDREALFHAVFTREIDELADMAERLDAGDDPLDALRTWLHVNVALVETKRGMLGALSVVMSDEAKKSYAARASRIDVALNKLIARGVETGRLREGVTAEDILQTMYALCYAREPGQGWRENVLRLLDIFIDGLAK